jgi:hypothetical protein
MWRLAAEGPAIGRLQLATAEKRHPAQAARPRVTRQAMRAEAPRPAVVHLALAVAKAAPAAVAAVERAESPGLAAALLLGAAGLAQLVRPMKRAAAAAEREVEAVRPAKALRQARKIPTATSPASGRRNR